MKLVNTILWCFLAVAVFGQSEFSEGRHDILRIENEIKLNVPNELSDSVWAYLIQKYDNNNLYLKKLDPSFECQTAVDSVIDQYYDNSSLDMLKLKSGIRHRTRYVLTDPNDRKNGRDLVQVKINNIGHNSLSRGEFKYDTRTYDKKEEATDSHVFLGLIKRDHRYDITERLKNYGVKSSDLTPKIKIVQIRKRVYISRNASPFATLTLDEVTAEYKNESTRFTEMELELNEIGYTESDDESRTEMESINELIKADILSKFPIINQDQTPKYNKAAIAMGIAPDEKSNNYIIYLGLIGLYLTLVVVGKRRKIE